MWRPRGRRGRSPASRVRAASGRPGVRLLPPRGGRRGARLVPSPRRRPAETLSGGGSSRRRWRCARNATILASHRCRSSRRTCCPGNGLGGKRQRERLSAPAASPGAELRARTAPRGEHRHPCLLGGGLQRTKAERLPFLGLNRAGWKDGVSCSRRTKIREETAKEGLSVRHPHGQPQDVTPSTPCAGSHPQAQEKAPKCDV